MKVKYDNDKGFVNSVDELVKTSTNEVFIKEELGLKQYFAPFHRKKGDGLDYLTTFYEGVINNNQKTYNNMINNVETGFPENVIKDFIRHKTELQIKDLLYRH